MTEERGTCSPSLNHHRASHWWQVDKARWFPPTVMALGISSDARQEGQLGGCALLAMTPYTSAWPPVGPHSPLLSFSIRPDGGYGPSPIRGTDLAGRPGGNRVAPGGRAHDDRPGPDGDERVHGLGVRDVHPDATV